jgi:hypothetical protein
MPADRYRNYDLYNVVQSYDYLGIVPMLTFKTHKGKILQRLQAENTKKI